MHFHEDCYRDRRTRIYCPVQRILQNSGVYNAEKLVHNTKFQPVIHFAPDPIIFPPGSSLLLDFGEALHGGVRLTLSGQVGKIHLKFGESISEALGTPDLDSSRRDAILDTPNYGMVEYGNTVFRFVQISNVGTTELKVQNILAVALELDLEIQGDFASSDERLNQIWLTAIRTVNLCMHEFIYDGAKRDRIVWMGDMHPEIRGIMCAYSDRSIIRDSLEFLMATTPPGKPINNFPSYTCWFLISVWEYYMATGDRNFLEVHTQYFQELIVIFSRYIGPDGAEQLPEHRFLDWPNENNSAAKHAGLQALLLWMMQSGAKIMHELDCDDQLARQAITQLQSHIPNPVDRKAPAALQTLTGLSDRRDVLEHNMFQDLSTFYGYYVLLAQRTQPALQIIRRYWGAMLDLGATSFWEDFDLNWCDNAFGIDSFPIPGQRDIHADFGKYCYKGLRHSLSHGWSCGPAPFLTERIFGVKFKTPGGKKIQIHPDLGDLEYARGQIPLPCGILTIEVERGQKCRISAPSEVEIV